jgi:hypothetical protein
MVMNMEKFLIVSFLAPCTTLSKIKGNDGEITRLLNDGKAEVWKEGKLIETRNASEEEKKIMMISWEEMENAGKKIKEDQEAYQKELDDERTYF